jgi:predicted bacteriocin transport accessory protein
MLNKKTLIYLATIAFVVVFAAQSFGPGDYEQRYNTGPLDIPVSKEDQKLMHEEYPNVPEQNRYIRQSYDQIMERFEKGTGIVFLGFKECPWCQRATPILNEVAEEEKVSIYYLDIRKLNNDDPSSYQALVRFLSPYLEKDEGGSYRIRTPDISFVKDGEIMWRYKMDTIPDEERSPTKYWTEDRIEQAKTNFRDQMKKLKED